MEKKKRGLKKKITLSLYAMVVYVLVGIVATGLIYLIYPETFMEYLPALGLFFVIAGIILSLELDRASHNPNARRVTNVFMLSRVIKLVITFGFLGLCVFYTDWDRQAFGISLMIFYLVYMMLDLYVYFLFNKQQKKIHNAHK